MSKGRLEAFSDGVLAIIITIMVLELKPPQESTLEGLRLMLPLLVSYVLSFIFVGIYWNNHHHLLQTVRHVNGMVLWANLHLLFWLSLTPFVTAWMGVTNFDALPVAMYGVVLLLSGFAYYVLTKVLIAQHGKESPLAQAVGSDVKGKISLVVYATGVLLALAEPAVACALYGLVACMWLIPDRRMERRWRRMRKVNRSNWQSSGQATVCSCGMKFPLPVQTDHAAQVPTITFTQYLDHGIARHLRRRHFFRQGIIMLFLERRG